MKQKIQSPYLDNNVRGGHCTKHSGSLPTFLGEQRKDLFVPGGQPVHKFVLLGSGSSRLRIEGGRKGEPCLVEAAGSNLDVLVLQGLPLIEFVVEADTLLKWRQPRGHVLQGMCELGLQEKLHLLPYLGNGSLSFFSVRHAL